MLFFGPDGDGFTDLLVLLAPQIDMFGTDIDRDFDKGIDVDPRFFVVRIVGKDSGTLGDLSLIALGIYL